LSLAALIKKGSESSVSVGARVKAMIPLFGGGEAETKGDVKAFSGSETKYEAIPINLELPQHVANILERANCKKWVILENFYYLNDETQKQFAFDLRAFQELGVRFVVLGVWREKNRMVQVVDSTFYFFIKNANIAEILDSLANPLAIS
jgi:hypothetical protein